MATNAFDSLILDVNRKISEMNTAIGEANGAAASAKSAANSAQTAAKNANDATAAATAAANAANEEAGEWESANVSAKTIEHGETPTVTVSESGGAKNIVFGIPEGERGEAGDKGDAGNSGVTFTLSGTTLYINTI